MSEALAIETVDLRKSFDAIDALRGLNLRVPIGSIFGFLGRNGAGKTTTIKLLLGMAHPTSGEARVFDVSASDPAASVSIRRRTGFRRHGSHGPARRYPRPIARCSSFRWTTTTTR